MDPHLTVIIVLNCLNLFVNLMIPLVAAAAYFITHIRKSDCCGSIVEVRSPKGDEKNPDISLEEFRKVIDSKLVLPH